MKQAEAQLLQQRGLLGGVIAPRLITNVKRNLGLPVSQDVIDAPGWVNVPNEAPIPVNFSQSMPTATTPQRQKAPGLFDRLRAVGQVLVNPGLINQPGQTPAQNVPTPTNQPGQAPAHNVPTPIIEEPHYHPIGMEPITKTGQTPAQNMPIIQPESEAAELQPVPLPVGFSKNGNGNHSSQ